MKDRIQRIKGMAVIFLSCLFTGCGSINSENAVSGKRAEEDGSAVMSAVDAVMEASAAPSTESEKTDTERKDMEDLREGTSDETLATPIDFPASYNYGTGTIYDWSRELMLKKMPEPENKDDTVLNAEVDPSTFQVFYLWEEGNAPAKTEFRKDMTGYFDRYDFRPYVTAIPVQEGVTPKGAVVLLAGGAYEFRGNYTDSLPTAAKLREEGFLTFIVDYRLSPYTQQEGALDVARAVRFIRKNADVYGIDPDDIAVMGYSAGGIQAGQFLMGYDGDVNGTVLDPEYVPDELDAVPAYAAADGMIYSFYGRLSHGTLDEEALRKADLPPTFYVYGTEDPFYSQFEAQYALLKDMGIAEGRIVLDDWGHGFGADGGWVSDYAAWLARVFQEDDAKKEDAVAKNGTSYTVGTSKEGELEEGKDTYRGFRVDDVLYSADNGDIHFSIYVPDSYDGTESYALFITLPGWEGLYFQGVGRNLRDERFAFEAQKYNDRMIIVAPQLNDWGETSADQTITLTEYLLDAYNIDPDKVYLEGYSGGGETGSLVVAKRPDLYAAWLMGSSRWDGAYTAVVEKELPVYLAVGENDNYYGSAPMKQAYSSLHDLYVQKGLSEEEIDRILVLDVKDKDYFTSRGIQDQHGGGLLFSEDEKIMGWLFEK